ncbi:hypothetical protein TEA_014696 [Camellia sinensis var. sinensis]|uniref:Uncharacterized protein n=1 Tax=Camellia sinensis var. sinensis TaxID=542762 RepID=A0A4S4DY05_CAMSN|nr:hypothetical protein TEA_014696 [Camellia sinensis var. sinensis]
MRRNLALRTDQGEAQHARRSLDVEARAFFRGVDMRDFLNAPNGLSKQSFPLNERLDADPSQSPLGGRTERMGQLQDAQKGAEVTSEATERELELEAQLVEARSIIQEQLMCCELHQIEAITISCMVYSNRHCVFVDSYIQLGMAIYQNKCAICATPALLGLYSCCMKLKGSSAVGDGAETRNLLWASIMSKHLAKSERPRRLSGHLSSERDSIISSPAELPYNFYDVFELSYIQSFLEVLAVGGCVLDRK